MSDFTRSVTRSDTHSVARSDTHSVTRSDTRSVTRSAAHSVRHVVQIFRWFQKFVWAFGLGSWVWCVWGVVGSEKAYAGACCMSSALSGVGRLRNWEKFAVGVRSGGLFELGQWDTKAKWNDYGSDYLAHEWRSEVWGLVGVHRQISLFARIPWSLNHRRVGDQEAWDGWFGDLQGGARFDLIRVGQAPHLPGLALIVGVQAPTGRATHQAHNSIGADVTGRGAWVLSAGAVLEKTFYPGFVQLDVGVQIPLPAERSDLGVMQRFGIGIPLVLTGGWEFAKNFVLALHLRFLWEDDLTLGERKIAESSRIDAGVSASLAWSFDPHWTLQVLVDSGIFASSMGRNQPGRLFASVGLRYGFF